MQFYHYHYSTLEYNKFNDHHQLLVSQTTNNFFASLMTLDSSDKNVGNKNKVKIENFLQINNSLVTIRNITYLNALIYI